MKNIKIISFIVVFVFVLNLANLVYATTGTVTGKTVRIREKAESSSEIITNAYRDDIVNVIDEEGDWYKVEYEGNTGYISKEFVNVKEYNPVENNNTVETNESGIESNNSESDVEQPNVNKPTIKKDTFLKYENPLFVFMYFQKTREKEGVSQKKRTKNKA